jgi:hypothetical protein
MTTPPLPPSVRLCLGVTGHREDNPAFATNQPRIEAVLEQILDLVASVVAGEAQQHGAIAPTRLHSLLADGADQIVASSALARGWELIAPLPFGLALNVAINAQPETLSDARALLGGALAGCTAEVRERADRIHALAARAQLFELADRDELISELYLANWELPDNRRKASIFAAETSLRAALAGRIMIEQSDLLIAVWDGATRALVGGTGHTIQIALETGTPVVWIDANAPDRWRILYGQEALAGIHSDAGATTQGADRRAELQALVRAAVRPEVRPLAHQRHDRPQPGIETMTLERWRVRSNPVWHFYRRVEALFGADTLRGKFRNLRQTYEPADAIATGSAAELLGKARALPGQRQDYVAKVEAGVLRRFAWADGVSARLSDIYRGGMTGSFLLAPLAIVGGIAYLPFASSHEKWMFALFELVLLVCILAIALTGQRHRWHGRWFETRRVAEYLRHAPILLLFGVARAPGRWPMGTQTSWPEWYARHVLREAGLPQTTISSTYLRRAVSDVLQTYVVQQRDYHRGKARRLGAVHHNLDHFAEVLFVLAVVSVSAYLLLKGGALLHLWPMAASEHSSYLFTFLGVLLPTYGAALAGIRYFGDFERFAAISTVTAAKLHAIDTRITLLLEAPDYELDYGRVADLAHAMDDVVVSEIESWQAVFGGKRVTVPV